MPKLSPQHRNTGCPIHDDSSISSWVGSQNARLRRDPLCPRARTRAERRHPRPHARRAHHRSPPAASQPPSASPAGSFLMGADASATPRLRHQRLRRHVHPPRHGDFDEVPAHPVRITHTFTIGITEVSPAEYRPVRPHLQAATPPLPHMPPESVGSRPWPTAAGSPKRPASLSACPPKLSGNTSPAPAAQESSAPPTRPYPLDQPNAFGVENHGASAAPSGPWTGTPLPA